MTELSNRHEYEGFWKNAVSWTGSITPKVIIRTLFFVVYAAGLTFWLNEHPALSFMLGPFEASGATLGILLVLRTNAGYERWWEARKLWGGIVNQSRNLVVSVLQYGPQDAQWTKEFTNWTIVFAHCVRRSLRGESDLPELAEILTPTQIRKIQQSDHMPGYVSQQLARLLQVARDRGMDGFSFLQVDRERALLMDHLGACERILKTPIPLVLAFKIRRFILLFLMVLPVVLIPKVGWFTPAFMLVIAYPLFALDQIGVELQNPFCITSVSHLPLDDITRMIQRQLTAYFSDWKNSLGDDPLLEL